MQPRLIPPSSLFSFLPFFFVFCNLPTSLSADYKWYTECAPFQFQCGKKTYNISYPFGVPDRPQFCFVPAYNFICEDGSDVLEMDSMPYVVNEIDYEKNLLSIVKKEFLNQTCPHTNTTINQYRFDYSDQVRNLTVFYDCSTTVSSPPSGFQNVPCLANAFFTDQAVDEVPNPFESCNESFISVFQTAAVNIERDPSVFRDKVEEGFSVTWTWATEWCEVCENSGGRCGYNESAPLELNSCFCKDGSFQASCPPGGNTTSNGTAPGGLRAGGNTTSNGTAPGGVTTGGNTTSNGTVPGGVTTGGEDGNNGKSNGKAATRNRKIAIACCCVLSDCPCRQVCGSTSKGLVLGALPNKTLHQRARSFP